MEFQEVYIGYKRTVKFDDMTTIKESCEVYDAVMQIWDPDKIDYVEEVCVLCLSSANRILYSKISSGSNNGTVMDPKIIFQTALKANASNIIIVHNHPSGNTKPSESDVRITKKIKESAALLDLPLLDHLVISSEGYYSFADENNVL